MRITALIMLLAVFATGCVSQKKYKELQLQHTQTKAAMSGKIADLENANRKCEGELSTARAKANSLEDQLASERANLRSLQNALDKCLTSTNQGNVNIATLVEEIKASNRYIQHLVNLKNRSDSLNMVLTNNLTRSLSTDELKDVDVKVQKGVVYISLSDNMLYKSGSYQISAKANETLAKIAKIIKDYKDYDVLVEGNTDNVPISKENIRNNWDLSALRASSVVQALQNEHGVDPGRMTAGGRGEYNPVSSNESASGRTQNRRTEIIILPKLDQFMDLIGKGPELDAQKEKMMDGK